MATSRTLLNVSNTFYFLWGIIHFGLGLATGVTQLSGSSRDVLVQMSEILPPETLPEQVPNVVNGVLAQHSWNLIWIGLLAIALTLSSSKLNAARWPLAAVTAATEVGLVVSLLVTGFETLFPIVIGPIIWIVAILADLARVNIASRSNRPSQLTSAS